jgi:hypothetical protein
LATALFAEEQIKMPDDKVVSVHEAGHVLAAHALGRPINSVTLTESGGEFREYEVAAWEPTTAEGKQAFRDAVLGSLGPQHLNEMLPMLISLSAGLAAQRRIAGRAHDDYGNADMAQCESIARAVAPGREQELLTYAQERAERIVTRHWRQIAAVSAELLLHRRLDAEQIKATIRRAEAPLQRLVYGYERRDGRTMPTQNPDPRRMTSVTMRRTDGYIA